MYISSAILAAALGAAMLATPALADASSIGISYSDLNLTTPQGQAQLNRRIDMAARDVCGISDQRTGTRMSSTAQTECLEQAKASARKQVAQRIEQDAARGG